MNIAHDGEDGPPGPARRGRLLLDLCHMAPAAEAIGTAAELAALLHRDLFGIYVEDEAVQRLAGLPFARELRPPSWAWSSLESGRIDAEFQQAAGGLQALLRQFASRFDVRSEFQAVRADPAGYVAGMSDAADVVALAAPREASTRAFGSFAAAWRAAVGSPATPLLLPSRLARRRGPVVVVLGPGAASRARAAAAFASAAGEELVALVLDADAAEPSLNEASRSAGLAVQRLSVRRLAEPGVEGLLRAVSRVGGRLVMLDRRFVLGAERQAATRLSEALGVPLLFD